MRQKFRCRICNSVSDPDICDETSPLHLGWYHEDGLGFLCSECEDEYDDGLVYFYEDDEDE